MSTLYISWPDVYGIAQAVGALVSVFFVWYIFVYTRQKDANDVIRNLRLQDQNIKIQWFKDLIIQPNFILVTKFYEDLSTLSLQLRSNILTLAEKTVLNDEIKRHEAFLRRSFVNLLSIADATIETNIISNLDSLVDGLTEAIFNEGIHLGHAPTFEREISNRILQSKSDLIATLYSFKGL